MLETLAVQPVANKQQISFLTKLFATGFYSGYTPIAPGTAGSLVAAVVYLLPNVEKPILLLSIIVLFFFIGTLVACRMEKVLGEDPPVIVIDEMVGMWISYLFLPKTLTVIVLGFLFFRGFDIFKPPPARRIEKLKNGWGIMLDDVIAGIYANLTVQIILLLTKL